MNIRFWGARGSIPAPGPETVKYGGNTSCVEIRPRDDQLFICDAGTGIRPLGQHLMQGAFARGKGQAHLFISHTHWDHIQGFPFFAPLLVAGNRITIYGMGSSQENLRSLLSGQMQYSYFPVNFKRLRAQIKFIPLKKNQPLTMDGVKISSKMLNHPGGCLAYRFEAKGRVFIYATDSEPYQDVLLSVTPKGLDEHKGFDQKLKAHLKLLENELVAFVQGADLLVYDTQYTAQEYPQRVGFGHGYPEYALQIALAAGVKQLVLFHHDPNHTDQVVDREVKRIQARLKKHRGSRLTIQPAYEGLSITL